MGIEVAIALLIGVLIGAIGAMVIADRSADRFTVKPTLSEIKKRNSIPQDVVSSSGFASEEEQWANNLNDTAYKKYLAERRGDSHGTALDGK